MSEKKRLGFCVQVLAHKLRRAVDCAVSESVGPNVTARQCRVIGFIKRHGDTPVYQRDIEEHFQIRRSTATEMLQLMEKNGLITKSADDSDGRLKRIMLTPEAEGICEKIFEGIDGFEARLSSDLSKEELDAFFSVADKISQNIEGFDTPERKTYE